MTDILQEENQKLRARLSSVEERLRQEVQVNRTLVEQAQVIDSSLSPEVKTDQYSDAYEVFLQYGSGYSQVATLPGSPEDRNGVLDLDRVLTILYEVQTTLEENTGIRSQIPKSGDTPTDERPDANGEARQTESTPVEHLQTVAEELQSRSADFAKFLSSYVNMLTRKNITEVRPQVKHNLEPYFAEKSDLRQATTRLAGLYENGLFVKQGDMSTMSSDLHSAVLDVISGLIHVLQAQQEGLNSF